MKIVHWIALAAALVVPQGVFASERIALLIGNQGYDAKVGELRNPHNDVAQIGAALRSLKFKVTEVKDADYKTLQTSINRHIQAVRRGGDGAISLIYYSGHGAADADTNINYIIPVDVTNADDEDLWSNSVNLNRIVEALSQQAPTATHYVVFDACRNTLNLTRRNKRVLVERGFVPIAFSTGVMVAYATAPGKTATDAGVYAKVLAEEIVKPGFDASTMFRRVAVRVKQVIGQDPWILSSTLPEHYFAGIKSKERQDWEAVSESADTVLFRAFLSRYPNGEYAAFAKARIQQLEQQAKADQAAREQAMRAEEVRRLEEKLKEREAALAEQAKRMGQSSEGSNAKAENKVLSNELNKLREETRLAREAAKTAEKQRIEAEKIAKSAAGPVHKAAPSRPDALQYSLTIWPKGSLKTGQTVSTNTPHGKLTCTSQGPSTRPCRWN